MPGKARHGAAAPDERPRLYDLNWPGSNRWNPSYDVPRNSLDSAHSPDLSSSQPERRPPLRHGSGLSGIYGRSRRDVDILGFGVGAAAPEEEEELSSLTHWLETLAEVYMNNIDNRARREPRWLNITRRERFEGLASASLTVVDYLRDGTMPRSELITTKNALAEALQTRPPESEVRVIMVSDLSRFAMGALGQMCSVDPEFWFEYLANSGYSAGDTGLKLKNAVWLNSAGRETRFRHRALPGPGQRTEWNTPRRTRGRTWAHLRWGRLGLLNYLGRLGFYEDEIEKRLADGRWTTEHDVTLDKHGLLLTKKRQARLDDARQERKEKEEKKRRRMRGLNAEDPQQKKQHEQDQQAREGTTTRHKTSNVYRAYSTFESLPKNPAYWNNRDLRVMAPEGASYWRGVDGDGRRTVIILLDPVRKMKGEKTGEVTPSLTFMPRLTELETATEDELWRVPEPDETFLDPPPPVLSKEKLKKQKKEQRKEAVKKKTKARINKVKEKVTSWIHDDEKGLPWSGEGQGQAEESKGESDDDSVSSYSSDTEYSEEYEAARRSGYQNPRVTARDRDFARKYALTTHDLLCRHLSTVTTSELLEDDSLVPAVLTRILLDDLWQLIAEMRLELDHLDGDFGGDMYAHLLESVGNKTRQNLNWLRSTLIELCEWTSHLIDSSPVLSCPPDLLEELVTLDADLRVLQGRTDQTLSLLAMTLGLAQSSLVIDQTSGINKLTELAFFFIPISFITSFFSMQVSEFISAPPPLWSWGVALSVIVLAVYFIRIVVRSPSVRIYALNMRATILSRFTSSSSGSAARRLNTVGTRAMVKFIVFFVSVFTMIFSLIGLYLFTVFFIYLGLWLGAAGTALYFIITRWPDPAVLIPCFISLPLDLAGMLLTWYWQREITDYGGDLLKRGAKRVVRVFPAQWRLDNADDDDLAKEGVNIYARQALVLAT